MKKASDRLRRETPPKPKPDLLPEYDFTGGVRGKYVRRFRRGTNIVVLAPDVAKLFPDSESVNRTLRACGEILRGRRRRRSG